MIRNIFFTTILCASLVFSVKSQTTQLTVRAYSEGFYRPSTGKMVAVIDSVNLPNICDTAIIGLIDTVSGQTVYCESVLVNTSGYGVATVPATFHAQRYKVSMKFRNTFHILSKTDWLMYGVPISLDLTRVQNVCCNYDTTYGVVKVYSGDIDGDSYITSSDFLLLDADIQSHNTGYLITDLNGDQLVDSLDANIILPGIQLGRVDDYSGSCNSATGISQLEISSMEIYPNPCNNFFRIESVQTFSDLNVMLVDVFGRIMLNENYPDEKMITIDCNTIPSGIYKAILKTEKGILQKSIVIMSGDR